ncbi:MAG: response regulator [Nitrospirae bacterium]|nr:response regulator [Nitrospirota bacterium]MCL5977991.1 response regulator [Nitrospirota bacterium]
MTDNPKHEIFNILFVDDEENVLRSLKRLFIDDDNIEVFTASSGKDGLDILKNNEIAVIVSDQRMPEMSGAQFLEKAKKVSPDCVRIVLTGYADVNAAMDAINKGGAFKYITKPWDDTDLMLTVLNSIETYRLKKENRRLTELTKKQNEELKKWNTELEFYVQQHTVDLTKQNKELNNLNEKLKRNLKEFITAFSNLIELRDKTVRSHSNTVAALSGGIALKLGLSESEIENIIVAAQLHDVGKIGIPDIVLIKDADELTSDEMEEYIKHPVRGQAAVDPVEELREAGMLIRSHHEWYDGNGFPDRLSGNKIPLGSRIIAVADKLDRLTSGGNSRLSLESALNVIKSLSGIQFDPELYGMLHEVAKEKITIDSGAADAVEVELRPKDLMTGLIVSRDVRSGTGLLLLRKGATLNERNIETMKRGYHIDPSKSGIFVWKRTR